MAKYRLIAYNDKYYVQVKNCWFLPWDLHKFYKAYGGVNKNEFQIYETLGHKPIPFTSLDEAKYVVDFLNTHKHGGVFYTTLLSRSNEENFVIHYCMDYRRKNSREYYEAYSRADLEKEYPVFIKNAKVIYDGRE